MNQQPPAQSAGGNDPFAVFSQQLTDRVAQEQAKFDEQINQKMAQAQNQGEQFQQQAGSLQNQMNGQLNNQLNSWNQQIQQVVHEEGQQKVQQQLNQLLDEANPVLQAVAENVQQVVAPVSGLTESGFPVQSMRLELAQGQTGAPGLEAANDPFAVKKTPTQAPNAFPTSEPAPLNPAPEGQPMFGFPAGQAETQQPAVPSGFPQAAAVSENAAEPAPVSPFAAFTMTAEEVEQPAPPEKTTATPAAEPPITLQAPEKPVEAEKPVAAPSAFFEGFDKADKMSEEASDSPYRLVPQFNGSEAESSAPAREPAPFQFSSEPGSAEPQTEPAPAMTPSLEPAPAVEPAPAADPTPAVNPVDSEMPRFSPFAIPPVESVPETREPGPAEPLPGLGESPAPEATPAPAGFGFPGFPPAGEENKPVEMKAEPAPAFQLSPEEEPNSAEPVPVEKEVKPEAEKPQMEVSPFSALPAATPENREPAGFPGAAPVAREQPAAKMEITPQPEPEKQAAKATKAEPLRDDELIGSAQVDAKLMESIQQPKIELYKSAPENAVLGQPLIYSIEVVNSGEVAVRDVVVEDQFPAGTKLTGTIPRAELVDKTLVWKFPELKPAERKKIMVRVVSIEAGTIGSISTVSYKSVVAAQTLVTAPRLELTVSTSETEVALGESVFLTFVVANTGQGEARDVVLRNLIPVGLEHPAGADLEYEIGLLKGGETKEIKLGLQAREPGRFANHATIKAAGGFSVEEQTSVNIIPSVLTLTQNGPTRRFVGHVANLDYTLKNNTQRTLTDVAVAVNVPAGLEFQSASESGRFNSAKQTVNWNFAQLQPGQEIEMKLILLPRTVGIMELAATAKTGSAHQADVSSQMKVEGFASLAVRVPDERGPVAKGERVSLRFKVVNRGSADAHNVVVKCKIPEQLEYISANGPTKGEYSGQVVQFAPVGTLTPNQEITLDLVFNAHGTGDTRVEFETTADQITTPIKHQQQVIVYGD